GRNQEAPGCEWHEDACDQERESAAARKWADPAMSDPRTDFFASGGDTNVANQDARTAFFSSGADTQESPKIDNSWWGAIKGDADIAATMASHAVVDPLAAAARTVNRVIPEAIGGPGSRAAVENDINSVQNRFTYSPQTEEGKYGLGQIGSVVSPIVNKVADVAGSVIGKQNVPAASDAF